MSGHTADRVPTDRLDAVVVGAGFTGLYMLHRLRRAGFSARLFESGSGVGGTWYHNRYPGARCDIESMDYSYSFDEGLQQNWSWSERYASQPELLRYLNHVADRYELRPHIELDTKVVSAHFDNLATSWTIQLIPIVAEQATHLHVCQRTANFCMPAQNRPLWTEEEARWKAEYPERRARARVSGFGHSQPQNPYRYRDLTPEQRRVELEARWEAGGLYMMRAFKDVLSDPEANEAAAEFARGKIRGVVKDPEVAELLSPRGFHFGTKRLCSGTQYYETFNRDNVTLNPGRRAVDADRGGHPDRAADRRGTPRARCHRVRHGVRRDDRLAVAHRHPRRGGQDTGREVGGGSANLPGLVRRALPQPLPAHRPW
jgi:cation diffusion facilitator CzcD-associated flavoprotein CzcO